MKITEIKEYDFDNLPTEDGVYKTELCGENEYLLLKEGMVIHKNASNYLSEDGIKATEKDLLDLYNNDTKFYKDAAEHYMNKLKEYNNKEDKLKKENEILRNILFVYGLKDTTK